MKLELKDFFESCLECLDPRTVRRRFVETGGSLEQIIRQAHDDLSKVEEKIVEDKDAAQYSFTGILATQMHTLLEQVGKVKQSTDKYAALYWLAIVPYVLFLIIAVVIVTLPQIKEIWPLFFGK